MTDFVEELARAIWNIQGPDANWDGEHVEDPDQRPAYRKMAQSIIIGLSDVSITFMKIPKE